MACADVFVLMDTAQVPQGRSWATRNCIKTPSGARWLSLPVHRHGSPSYIEARVVEAGWFSKMWGMIEHNYTHAPYFQDYASGLWSILHSIGGYNLAIANTLLIHWVCGVFGIKIKLVNQSDTSITADKHTLAQELCQAVGADTYLSGQGAKAYNDAQEFKRFGIKLRYDEFNCQTYQQMWGEFIPNLSIIDLLFNCGPEAKRILLNDITQ